MEKLIFIHVRGFFRKETTPARNENKEVKVKMDVSNTLMIEQKKRLVSKFELASTIFLCLLFFSRQSISANPSQSFDEIRKSVVQIRVYSQAKDPYSPWLSGQVQASTGTGFLIGKNRILTNAHVISNAKFMEGQRHKQTEWYGLKLIYVAHDCDLAILEATSDEFYDDITTLEFGDIPELTSQVDIVGYPIGGSKISVSRGIVSRIEQSSYAHSQIDSHLVIQVDAAINPGNSGGPALQNGKVVGVAFQASTRGENIGYIIPTIVIKHFLKDIEDGKYDGYVELGIHTTPSYSDAGRKYYKIPKDQSGVFVSKVLQGGSAYGYLQKGDFLISIDGNEIGKNGNLKDQNNIDFLEIVDNKFAGQIIEFELIRNGEQKKVQFPAKRMLSMDLMRNSYDTDYDYFMFGGLIFQKTNRDLLESWSKSGQTQSGSLLLYRFYHFNELITTETEDVVLYRKLSHPNNTAHDYFLNLVVSHVNNVKVNNLNQFKDLILNSKDNFIQLKFYGISIPLILNKEESLSIDSEIKKLYQIGNTK